jgi:cytidine deaminase
MTSSLSAAESRDPKLRGGVGALFDAALAARANAYAPYSQFPVGAALRSAEGGLFAGCNVENASYPIVTCAEAGAIAAMVAAGHKRIAEFLVIGGDDRIVTPCGACRQRLREFAGPEVVVHCATPSGSLAAYSVEALLPASFGSEHLAGGR